jgi:hypothetical protein
MSHFMLWVSMCDIGFLPTRILVARSTREGHMRFYCHVEMLLRGGCHSSHVSTHLFHLILLL